MTQKMIKILYIIDKIKEAGAQKHLLEVIRGIDKDNFEVCLAVLENKTDVQLEDIPIINLRVKRIYGISGIIGLCKLIRLIRNENFDIVHTYLFSENILGSIAAKLAKTKVIITSRRDTGMLMQGKWQHILAYKFTNQWVDKIICVSDAVKKIVLEKEKVKADKLATIYNGVDMNKFTINDNMRALKESVGIKKNEFVVGLIANLSWVKGHKEFVSAAQIILKEIPNVKFLLIGDGPLRESLQSTVNSQQLTENILFLGRRQDIPELLSIMDISVNASYSEGMSNTILESMASGIPVVATAVDGNLETVVDGVTGILVPAHNPDVMARALIKILKNKESAQRMNEASRELVRNKFAIRTMLENMEGLYKGLIAKCEGKNSASKVLFIFSQFPCYDETFILREMNSLKQRGLNFRIFSLKVPKDKITHNEAKELAGDTIYVPFISLEVFLAQFYFLLRHPIKYLNVLFSVIGMHLKSPEFIFKSLALFPQSVYMAKLAKKMDVSHIHGQWATHPASSAFIIWRLTGIPFSFTGHAHDIYVNTAGLKEKITQAKFVTTCTGNNKKHLMEVVGTGQLISSLAHQLENKIIVNYHGVDLEKFNNSSLAHKLVSSSKSSRAQELKSLNIFRILSVGSLLECKGFDILIEACRILKDKGVDFECTIAGGGPLENSLRSTVDSQQLKNFVKFTGYITQDELIPLYQQADVFALPVRLGIHWGIPNVVIEAMAAKVPVICTNLPSITEIIQDYRTGFIVSEEDPFILAKTIQILLQDESLRKEVGFAGYKIVEEKFDIKKNAKNLLGLFNRIAPRNDTI